MEIGSRIDETPDVSDLGDMGDPGPTSEQQALQKQAALCESIRDLRAADSTTKTIPNALRTVFVGNPSIWARRLAAIYSRALVWLWATWKNMPAQPPPRTFCAILTEPGANLCSLQPRKGRWQLSRVAWGALKRYQVSSYHQFARHDSQCLGGRPRVGCRPSDRTPRFLRLCPLCFHLK